MSHRIDFKINYIPGDNEEFIMIKGSTHQEEIKIIR